MSKSSVATAIPDDFSVVTTGIDDGDGKKLIDHIAVSPDLLAAVTVILPKTASDGTMFSDHVGIAALVGEINAIPIDPKIGPGSR